MLCTVHAANGNHPLEVYRFFRDDRRRLHPVHPHRRAGHARAAADRQPAEPTSRDRPLYRRGHRVTERSVGPSMGRVPLDVFDEWVRHDVGTVFVQIFDVALGICGHAATLCVFAETCGNAVAIEHNGDLYSCDHYVDPEAPARQHHARQHMLDWSPRRSSARSATPSATRCPRYCRECDVRFACNGECPKHRFLTTPDGEPGSNYLCAGYKAFFHHIDGPMRTMADLVRQGRYADEVMALLN